MAEEVSINQKFNQYVSHHFAPEDSVLKDIKAAMAAENVRAINVSSIGGKTLHFLALLIGAKRILEIGTLGGYSATWLARALPEDGRLITLELEQHHADVAQNNLEHAGVADRVEIRVGPALETLNAMLSANEPLFDLVFIDADKDSYPAYLDSTLPLVREGGLILADNTFRQGVEDPNNNSAIAKYNAAVAAHPELVSIMIPMLRTQGLDGLLISMKQSK